MLTCDVTKVHSFAYTTLTELSFIYHLFKPEAYNYYKPLFTHSEVCYRFNGINHNDRLQEQTAPRNGRDAITK